MSFLCVAEGDLHVSLLEDPVVLNAETALAQVGKNQILSIALRAVLQLFRARAVPGKSQKSTEREGRGKGESAEEAETQEEMGRKSER